MARQAPFDPVKSLSAKMQTMDNHYGTGAEIGLIFNFCYWKASAKKRVSKCRKKTAVVAEAAEIAVVAVVVVATVIVGAVGVVVIIAVVAVVVIVVAVIAVSVTGIAAQE